MLADEQGGAHSPNNSPSSSRFSRILFYAPGFEGALFPHSFLGSVIMASRAFSRLALLRTLAASSSRALIVPATSSSLPHLVLSKSTWEYVVHPILGVKSLCFSFFFFFFSLLLVFWKKYGFLTSQCGVFRDLLHGIA